MSKNASLRHKQLEELLHVIVCCKENFNRKKFSKHHKINCTCNNLITCTSSNANQSKTVSGPRMTTKERGRQLDKGLIWKL